ncbi:S1/P1 nuclease [Roseiconus lacunae]|uniref:S1/P1 nuclease n=1 Tax=Roseiconus lacunae TaxID=2605694 RepID=UPI00308475D0|nr:S1/P1 nuclease [Stieleria sp. HD01]
MAEGRASITFDQSLPPTQGDAMIRLTTLLAVLLFPSAVLAWSATGHHVVCVVAYDLMSEDTRAEAMGILSHHPDFNTTFKPPSNVTQQANIERWQIGVAGCWPDIIRRSDEDRPKWHYQLGATLVIDDAEADEPPGPLPIDATMDTKDLHIFQALELALKVYRDEAQPKADRAIALCWICHLVGDSHQPCHVGSLYAPCFRGGDRGANSIRLVGGGNLHSAWDRLLGSRATANDVRRRVAELELTPLSITPTTRVAPTKVWQKEARDFAKENVYTNEVLAPVRGASRNGERLPNLQLSDEYFSAAGRIAKMQAAVAGHRLASLLSGVELLAEDDTPWQVR